MNRNKKITVYTQIVGSKTVFTLRFSHKASTHGYWHVVEFDGQESIRYHTMPVWTGEIPMPAKFWIANRPTERDFS